MGKFTPDVVRIASIFPGKTDRIAMDHGPSQFREDGTTTFYELKPATATKPYMLEITDSFQHYKDEIKTAATGMTQYGIHPIACEDIADYLIRMWAGNLVDVPADAKPGIMIIRGATPHQDEIRLMKEQQRAYFEFFFLEGERLAKDAQVKQISPPMKLAAEYLGRPRPWSHASNALENIKCPACKFDIPEDSYICGNCGTKLRALPAELQRLNEEAMTEA